MDLGGWRTTSWNPTTDGDRVSTGCDRCRASTSNLHAGVPPGFIRQVLENVRQTSQHTYPVLPSGSGAPTPPAPVPAAALLPPFPAGRLQGAGR